MADDLIGRFSVSDDICDKIITFYEDNSNEAHKGCTHSKDPEETEKKSMDITVDFRHELDWQLQYFKELDECFQEYRRMYPWIDNLPSFQIDAKFNVQKYKKGGHFNAWHCERGWTPVAKNRVLVFMTYLNDVKDTAGGTTDFLYQDVSVKPKKGKTLIWPAEWTHVHRGGYLKSGVKYITTGWYSVVD